MLGVALLCRCVSQRVCEKSECECQRCEYNTLILEIRKKRLTVADRPNLLDISRFSSVIRAAAAQSATLRCAAAATDAESESTGTTFANSCLKDT